MDINFDEECKTLPELKLVIKILKEEIRDLRRLNFNLNNSNGASFEKILEISRKNSELRQKLECQRRTSHTLRNKLIELAHKKQISMKWINPKIKRPKRNDIVWILLSHKSDEFPHGYQIWAGTVEESKTMELAVCNDDGLGYGSMMAYFDGNFTDYRDEILAWCPYQPNDLPDWIRTEDNCRYCGIEKRTGEKMKAEYHTCLKVKE